jgi:hypothetical protein
MNTCLTELNFRFGELLRVHELQLFTAVKRGLETFQVIVWNKHEINITRILDLV